MEHFNLFTCYNINIEYNQYSMLQNDSSIKRLKKLNDVSITNFDTMKKKDNFSFHVTQASTVFLTASRAYGIYDKEYHVIASD